MAVKPIPDGHRTVTPYLVVEDVAKLLDFLQKAFQAEVVFRMDRPDGGVSHAEVRIGDSMVMMGQARSPGEALEAMIHLYVTDSDAWYTQALAAGGTSVMPVTTMFYGDRSGGVKDPAGNQWWISTHVEDVPHDEIARRAAAMGR